MRTQVHASPDDIDITSLWSVLKRSGLRIVLTSAAIGALTYAGLALLPSRYTSEAQLRIGGQGINDPFRDPKVGTQPSSEALAVRVDKEAIATQVAALRSRDLAARLASELKLATMPEFNSALKPDGVVGMLGRMTGLDAPPPGETEEERVMRAFDRALRVYQLKDTRVIAIEFTTQRSELSSRAANRLAELYQTWLRAQGVVQTADASEWLKPEIEKRAREVAEAESAVESFRSQANLFRGGSSAAGTNTSLNEQQLVDLTTEVSKTRSARSEAEARARAARELLARGSAEAIPDVQKSPTIQALISQRVRAEREKAEADTSLLAGHPRMKQLNANVTDLRRAITKEAQLIVEGLEKEAKTVALREELAVKSLDEMKARVGTKSNDIARLAALEGAAKAKRAELDKLQASFEAARSRGDVKAVPLEAQVISSARPSSTPSSPKRAQLAGLASAASLILGFALVVTRELIGGARRQGQPGHMPAPAPMPPAQPTLAMPPSRNEKRAPAAAAQASPAVPAAAAAAAVATTGLAGGRTAASAPAAATVASAAAQFATHASVDEVARRILAGSQTQGGYRTVIVGESVGTEVREEAADLAGALSAAGKQVALVDWSLDGHGIAVALGLDPTPGFMDLLDGTASFEDVIRRLPDGDAHVVPCGSARQNATLDADRLNLVLDALDEAYDHIIVTGEHQAIRDLFLAIEGRFDAGVLVAGRRGTAAANAAPGTFLGFQVTDIDVVRLDPTTADRGRKMQLARAAGSTEARV